MELSHSCKTIGGTEWVSIPHIKFLNDWPSSTLMQSTPTHMKRAPAANWKVAYYPHFIEQEEKINSTKPSNKPDKNLYLNGYQMNPTTRHESMPQQSWGEVASEEYLSPKLSECDRQCGVVKFLLLLLNELQGSVKTLISIVIC